MLLEESVYVSSLTYHPLSCRNSITHLSNRTETCSVSGVPYPLLPIGIIRSYTHHPHGQCFRCLYYYFKELYKYTKVFSNFQIYFGFFLRFFSEVGKTGLEPAAPCSQRRYATNCATFRFAEKKGFEPVAFRYRFSRPVHSTLCHFSFRDYPLSNSFPSSSAWCRYIVSILFTKVLRKCFQLTSSRFYLPQ